MNDAGIIFQVEKTNDEIRKTVLTNAIKMITERKLLKKDRMEENIKHILGVQSDDYTYVIDMTDGKKLALKLIQQKITAISKQSNIGEFLHKYKDLQKIVIVKGINTKSRQYILNNYQRTEVFLESELMIDIISFTLQPKFELLAPESEEAKTFCNKFLCKKRNMPRMYTDDAIARYYNLKHGDIVRIIRPSESSGYAPSYRIVVQSSSKN